MPTDYLKPYQSNVPEHAPIRARASRICTEARNPDGLLQDFAHLLLEHLCDLVAIDLVEDDGSIKRRCTRHLTITSSDHLAAQREQYPLNPTAAYGYPRVIKTGKSQFIPAVAPRIADRLLSSPSTLTETTVVRSYICAPLIAHGRILGAMTVANTERTTFFSADDLLLVEELCSLLAMRLDGLL